MWAYWYVVKQTEAHVHMCVYGQTNMGAGVQRGPPRVFLWSADVQFEGAEIAVRESGERLLTSLGG